MRTLKIFLVALGISLLVASCAASQVSEPLPIPDAACPLTIEWHKIIPGKSSRQDVIDAFGQPSQISNQQFGTVSTLVYIYKIEGGVISRFAQDRVFFRPDGVVDWIEAIVADRDGSFHPAQEVVNQIGSTLDTAYMNSNYDPSKPYPLDVLAGPDQIYVWSECGIALDVHNTCSSGEQGKLGCQSSTDRIPSNTPISSTLTMRYPSPYHLGGEPSPSVNSVVLMEFLFSPTSYKGFTETYMRKIPYGSWDTYLREIRGTRSN
jgi:hypothetical protein